jgi:hypothetical protein
MIACMFSVPGTSAPIERIFSHSGLFIIYIELDLGDKMLSSLFLCVTIMSIITDVLHENKL